MGCCLSQSAECEKSEGHVSRDEVGQSVVADDPPVLSWRKVNSTGQPPGPRRGHTLVTVTLSHSPPREVLVAFGGVASYRDRPDSYFFNEDPYKGIEEDSSTAIQNKLASKASYLYNPGTKEWTALSLYGPTEQDLPNARCSHSAVVYKGGMIVYGSHLRCDSVYRLDFTTGEWKVVSCVGKRPPYRGGHSAVVYNKVMYVFGGESCGYVTDQFYSLDLETYTWSRVNDNSAEFVLQCRRDHTAVVYKGKMYVYGGFGEVNEKMDFIVFDFATRRWEEVTVHGSWQPHSRACHTAVIWQDCMIIFGGIYDDTYFQDTALFNFTSQQWYPISTGTVPTPCKQPLPQAPTLVDYMRLRAQGGKRAGPPPSCYMASTILGDRWYMFGGGDYYSNFGEMFEMSLAALAPWLERQRTAPLAASTTTTLETSAPGNIKAAVTEPAEEPQAEEEESAPGDDPLPVPDDTLRGSHSTVSPKQDERICETLYRPGGIGSLSDLPVAHSEDDPETSPNVRHRPASAYTSAQQLDPNPGAYPTYRDSTYYVTPSQPHLTICPTYREGSSPPSGSAGARSPEREKMDLAGIEEVSSPIESGSPVSSALGSEEGDNDLINTTSSIKSGERRKRHRKTKRDLEWKRRKDPSSAPSALDTDGCSRPTKSTEPAPKGTAALETPKPTTGRLSLDTIAQSPTNIALHCSMYSGGMAMSPVASAPTSFGAGQPTAVGVVDTTSGEVVETTADGAV
eukprot:Sspe_Gene.83161::Locus_54550_Transcript_1_1_Confidence_1.000_Length_2287::g.83161::m.83161